MMERLNKAMSTALLCYKYLQTAFKISFHMRKKSVVTAKNYKAQNFTSSSAIDFAVRIFDCFLEQPSRMIADNL